MDTKRRPYLTVFCVLCVLCVEPPAARAQDGTRFETVITPYVDQHKFMGSVLIARGADIVFEKSYGSANLELNVANTAATKFRIGSITKQFTAASIMLLEERGKLKVEDPVKKYLPDVPESWASITIFNLLTHTSGIPNYTNFQTYRSIAPFETTPEKIVALVADKPLDFAPGEKFSYSNTGYVVLGRIVEKVSGTTYAAFVQDNLFAPAGMKDSGYDSNSAIIPNRASGYVSSPKGFANAGFVNMTVPFSAGALYSTTEDLLRWEQALFGGKIVSAASLKKMTTPFKDGYAFGLMIRHDGGRDEVVHGGGIDGFNTALEYFPATKTTVVVLGNVNGTAPDEIASKLGRVAHGDTLTSQSDRKEITVARETLAQYVGVYEIVSSFTISIRLEDDHLTEQATGQQKLPLFAESETMFFLKPVDAQVEFVKDDSGQVTGLVLHQAGRDQAAKRISTTVVERTAITVPVDVLRKYVGTYELRPGFALVVALDGDRLTATATNQGSRGLVPESPTKFFMRNLDVQIEFTVDSAGTATALVMHQGPITLTGQKK